VYRVSTIAGLFDFDSPTSPIDPGLLGIDPGLFAPPSIPGVTPTPTAPSVPTAPASSAPSSSSELVGVALAGAVVGALIVFVAMRR
jgi:TctA family transporter